MKRLSAKTIQLLSANPLALSFDRLMPRLELIKQYLPELEHMYTATRVSDIKNKTVEQTNIKKAICHCPICSANTARI